MDVTLSELLATFMESPLVLWVSGWAQHAALRMMTSGSVVLSLFSLTSRNKCH